MGTQNPTPGSSAQSAVAMANLDDNVDSPTTLVVPIDRPDDEWCADSGRGTMLDWASLEAVEVVDITSGRELSDQELRSRLGLEEA